MTKDEAISTLEYYKSINFDKSFRSFEDDQMYDALCMAIEALEKENTVAYLCDGKACDRGCSSSAGFCFHTTDICHAVNFEEVSPGRFMEVIE